MLFQRATQCCPSGCCFDSSQEDVWAVELTALLIHACCLLPHCWAGRISASCSPTFRIERWDLDSQSTPSSVGFFCHKSRDGNGNEGHRGLSGNFSGSLWASCWTYVSPGHMRTTEDRRSVGSSWGLIMSACLGQPHVCLLSCCYSRLRPGHAFKWPCLLIGHLRGLMRQLCKQCIFNSVAYLLLGVRRINTGYKSCYNSMFRLHNELEWLITLIEMYTGM